MDGFIDAKTDVYGTLSTTSHARARRYEWPIADVEDNVTWNDIFCTTCNTLS